MARIEPVLPKFLVKNISGGDLLIFNTFPIRPGQTVDIYKQAEYQSDRVDVTNMILRGLEMPDGDIYVKWKVKRKIEVIDFQNPNYQGNGITANKIQTTNAYFEGAVLSVIGGKLVWVDSVTGGGAAVSDFVLLAPDAGLPNSRVIVGEPGQIDLEDSGPGSNVTVSLVDTAVVPGIYGSSLQIPSITVDSKGRLTSVSSFPVQLPGQSINGIRMVTGDTTAVFGTDYTILVDASAGPITITLPSIEGAFFNVKKIDSTENFVLISPAVGLLDGSPAQAILEQWQSMSVQSLGLNWFIV